MESEQNNTEQTEIENQQLLMRFLQALIKEQNILELSAKSKED